MSFSLKIYSDFYTSTSENMFTLPKGSFKVCFSSDRLPVQSLRDHLSVHDRDVHEQEKDYKEIVHEAQKAEKRFGDDVKRRRQVGDRTNQAQEDSNPEHPEEAAHRKHLPEGVTKQGGNIPQPVHKLWGSRKIEKQIKRLFKILYAHSIFTSLLFKWSYSLKCS